jgi:4-amino-4-deoxy-L-arabinose transferase-like glycosyltransferase
VLTWLFARRLFGSRAALCAGLVLATGVECTALSRLMLTDVVFTVFVCGSMFALWQALEDEARRRTWLAVHGAASGLAMLTKGPLCAVIALLAIGTFLVLMRRRSPFRMRDVALSMGVFALVAAPWYAYMFERFGQHYFDEFFVHENWERILHAEHESSNHVWYYPVVLLAGSIPWIPWIALWLLRTPGRVRADARRAFLVSWLSSGLVFMTLVQSKLPTYIFFLFVPLALLVGETMDAVIERGFESARERWTFAIAGFAQALVLGAAPFLMSEQGTPFALPALVASGLLAVGVVSQLRRASPWGIACTAAAPCALLVLLLSVSAPEIEDMTSVRGKAQELMRLQHPGEPIVTDRVLVRGVTYYTQQPVVVLASKAQPFWTPHPLRILVGNEDFQSFLKTSGSVMVLMKAKDLPQAPQNPQNPQTPPGTGESSTSDARYFGDKVIKRYEKP